MSAQQRWSVFWMQPIPAAFVHESLGQFASLDEESGEISWAARINGEAFRRMRELSSGDERLDQFWSRQLDAMIAEQEDGDDAILGTSGPATRWNEFTQAQQEGLSSETWVLFLTRYQQFIERILIKHREHTKGAIETPDFAGFLSWFCQTERLERVNLRRDDGHVNAFRAWLYYQVRAYLCACYKRRSADEIMVDDIEAYADDQESGPALSSLSNEESEVLARQALENLKASDKEAFSAFVYRVRELSGIEIAALLSCSEATVSRRFSSALGLLRESMREALGADEGDDQLQIAQALISLSEGLEPLS